MAEFALPSGLVVETHEPTTGQELHIISAGLVDPETFTYLKCDAIVPGLTREEIAALNRKDGRALFREVNRIWNGRPEEKEIPFESKSPQASPEESLTKARP